MGLVYTHGQAIRFGVGAALSWLNINLINKEYMLGSCQGIIMRRYATGLWEMAGRITPKLS